MTADDLTKVLLSNKFKEFIELVRVSRIKTDDDDNSKISNDETSNDKLNNDETSDDDKNNGNFMMNYYEEADEEADEEVSFETEEAE